MNIVTMLRRGYSLSQPKLVETEEILSRVEIWKMILSKLRGDDKRAKSPSLRVLPGNEEERMQRIKSLEL